MRNERAWPKQCWKSCANGSNIVALRFGDHGTKEMLGVVGWKLWPVSNFAQQHATTTSNNMKQGVQTDATCNIQQCWKLLANNVASVSTGPKTEGSKEFNFWKDFYFALSANYLLQRRATHVCFHISISVILHHQTLTSWKFYEERKRQGILWF